MVCEQREAKASLSLPLAVQAAAGHRRVAEDPGLTQTRGQLLDHVEELLADQELASVAVMTRRAFLQNGQELEVRQRGLTGRERDGRLLIVDAGRVRVASVYTPYAPSGRRTKDQVRRSIHAKVKWLGSLSKCVAGQPGASKPTFLCGDFNVILDGECKTDTLNRSPDERAAMISLCDSGFVDLYRKFHWDGKPGFNSGTPITSLPDTRIHLILGTESILTHVKSARVDLEYRRPIADLLGEKWAPGAPVVIEIDDEIDDDSSSSLAGSAHGGGGVESQYRG